MNEYAEEQINTEEAIAFHLFHNYNIDEDDATEAGRTLLRLVMQYLDPTVYKDIYDLTEREP